MAKFAEVELMLASQSRTKATESIDRSSSEVETSIFRAHIEKSKKAEKSTVETRVEVDAS